MKDTHPDRFRQTGDKPFSIQKAETKIPDIYTNDADYEAQLARQAAEIDTLQTRLYADGRYGLLAIFQAMDAAGKDGTIQRVFTGTNPLGLRISFFKRPTDRELNHDWLWRTNVELPERGIIGIFNRSYYEEVLVAKVHPEIVTHSQRLPADRTEDIDELFKNRYEAIRDVEKHLYRNGFPTIKFFLHISKEEQADRLIARIEDPTKNWKFDEQDVKERAYWDDYQQAYEDAINETATGHAPWYVIPADDKKNMRLLVGRVIIHELRQLHINDEQRADPARHAELQKLIPVIRGE